MAYETELWPYVPALHIGPKRERTDYIVIHTGELREHPLSAENLAKYGQKPDYKSSWHIVVDNDSIVQCVKDSFIAYAAPPLNEEAIHIELACYAGQTKHQWLDSYSIGLLALAADATAQYALKYDIPLINLSAEQLKKRVRGVVGHNVVNQAFGRSTHTDPGPNFPWHRFMQMAKAFHMERS